MENMICTELWRGQGLGNQLACYVTTRCIALDKNYEFGILGRDRFKGASFMNLDFGKDVIGGVTLNEGQMPEKLPEGIMHYYKEYFGISGEYDFNLRDIEDNTKIDGLMQGIEYFKHRKDEIRDWLKVEPLEMSDNVCIINFRGGEYKYVKNFFLPKSYWDRAIQMMLQERPDMLFVVHTDDKEEAQKFFPDFPIISNIGINWRSIRYAHYLILSNSSFAILPAWLNENVKKVIAPWGMGRYNTGEWLLSQNYVPEWTWIKNEVGN